MLNIDLILDNTAADISSALCFTANTGVSSAIFGYEDLIY